MKKIYSYTESLCPICGKDSPAYYLEARNKMLLVVECGVHGLFSSTVENDPSFFKKRYEKEYKLKKNHLLLPVTYRCNLSCRYCYALSNSHLQLPQDRSIEKLSGIIENFNGNVTLIGGEPTVRHDLVDVIRIAKKKNPGKRISVGTNGQKLADTDYLMKLRSSGLDFVLLSFNDIAYDGEIAYKKKVEALDNCLRMNVPVWVQRTIDNVNQLDSIYATLDKYGKVIFNVTVRAVKPFGRYYPIHQIFLSDMLRYLGKENDFHKGSTPNSVSLYYKKKQIRLVSWVLDTRRLDPVDSKYVISDDTMTTLLRGMKLDEILLFNNNNNSSLSTLSSKID
ncbi:MAG TPA: radical SAM protein [Thermodesulfovibrionales bacterium]|nr:radical SAM protein [Thermodesulfovibrionales bacterium]